MTPSRPMTPDAVAPSPAPAHRGLTIKPSAAWDQAYAGEWLQVTFDLFHSAEGTRPLFLDRIISDDPELFLDVDLLQQRQEIGPGENYRCTIPLRVMQPRKVDLGSIQFVCASQGRAVKFKMPSRPLIIKPPIAREIAIQVKALCEYEQGTKVAITLHHQGGTPFKDLAVSFGPVAALRAGKPTLQRKTFEPGQREELHMVVAAHELEVVLAGTAGDHRVEARQTFPVTLLPAAPPKRFRFLEPTQLAKESVRIFRDNGGEELRRRESFTLESGQKYRVEIRPHQQGVCDVKLNEHFPIRKREHKDGAWLFTIDVTDNALLRHTERLHYEVEAEPGKFAGEIPICVTASQSKLWQTAGYLGFATTIKGIGGLAKMWDPDGASFLAIVELLRDSAFIWHASSSLFFALSIPVAYLLLRTGDWLQYRLRLD